MKKVTLENYKSDPYYSRITVAVSEILEKSDFVRPIDVFIKMRLLKQTDIDQWRKGKIPYLEKVIQCNLSKASRILRILRFHVHDLNLHPSVCHYKDKSKRFLQFSKTHDKNLEKAYSTHFVRLGKKKKKTGQNISKSGHNSE